MAGVIGTYESLAAAELSRSLPSKPVSVNLVSEASLIFACIYVSMFVFVFCE